MVPIEKMRCAIGERPFGILIVLFAFLFLLGFLFRLCIRSGDSGGNWRVATQRDKSKEDTDDSEWQSNREEEELNETHPTEENSKVFSSAQKAQSCENDHSYSDYS